MTNPLPRTHVRQQWVLLAVLIASALAFAPRTVEPLARRKTIRHLSNENDCGDRGGCNGDDHLLFESTVKIDDGGSDLTDRFKYKVNALMGVFDPPKGKEDNERSEGNILNAMLQFPVYYSFNVVGKTNSDTEARDAFVDKIKAIIQSNAGGVDECITCTVTPRGARFTKIAIGTQIENADIIASIYKELEAVDQVVMYY